MNHNLQVHNDACIAHCSLGWNMTETTPSIYSCQNGFLAQLIALLVNVVTFSALWEVGTVKEVMWCVSVGACIAYICCVLCRYDYYYLSIFIDFFIIYNICLRYQYLVYTWHGILKLRYLACPCCFLRCGALLSWILIFFVFMWPGSVLNEPISKGTSREPNEWPPKVTASHSRMVAKTTRLQLQWWSTNHTPKDPCMVYLPTLTIPWPILFHHIVSLETFWL